MVEEFFAKNNLGPKMAFEERAIYKEFALKAYDDLGLTDFLYDNPFYGKLDREGYAIALDETFLAQYESKTTAFGINFMVDAFEEFKVSFLLDLANKLGVGNYGSRYVQLTPSTAWTSIHSAYYDYQTDIYSVFSADFFSSKSLRKKICNFKKFLEYYFDGLKRAAQNNPITKIGFIKSNLAPPAISGLTLDLFSEFEADDDFKKAGFLQDSLLDYFIRSAVKHGLSIDVNVPWRLVCRLDSPQMKKFLNGRRLTVENVFDQAYNKVYLNEYADFKLTAMEYYNTLVSEFIEEDFPDYNKKGKMFIRKLHRKYATEVDVSNIPETYWLKKYFLIRRLEAGKKMSSVEIKRQDKQISAFYGKYGVDGVLELMEKRLIKLNPMALPKNRKEKFNYGVLNPETNIYSGSPKPLPKKTLQVTTAEKTASKKKPGIPVQQTGHVVINNGNSY